MILNTTRDPKYKYMNRHAKLSSTNGDSNISVLIKELKCYKKAKLTCINAYKKPKCKPRMTNRPKNSRTGKNHKN